MGQPLSRVILWTNPLGGETVSTLSVEALEASRGLRGPVNKPEKPISAEDNFALAA